MISWHFIRLSFGYLYIILILLLHKGSQKTIFKSHLCLKDKTYGRLQLAMCLRFFCPSIYLPIHINWFRNFFCIHTWHFFILLLMDISIIFNLFMNLQCCNEYSCSCLHRHVCRGFIHRTDIVTSRLCVLSTLLDIAEFLF